MRISDGSSDVCSSDLDRQFMAVDTLGEQVVLAGPAPDPSDRVGDQGPVAVAASVLPLPGSAVTAPVDAIPGTTLIDPQIGRASCRGSVSTGRSRWSPDSSKKKTNLIQGY